MATPRGVMLALVLPALAAHAGPKSLAIAAGDCRDAELLNGATAFSDAVVSLLKADAVDPAALLDRLKPRPNAGLDDVGRQYEAAQSQFYSGQLEQAVEATRSAIKTLERLPPSDAVAKQLRDARVLEGLIWKALNKKTEQLEAWRRLLRVTPDHRLDPDLHTPSAIAQFDQLKKELAKLKKIPLGVTSTPPGAVVFVDGTRAGTTPLKGAAFVPGDYKVTITTGDTQSFIYDVKLEAKPVELVIDLAFERTVRAQLPLCVNGTGEADALKLATRAGADQALVLRVDVRGSEPGWVSAVLFDVARGTRVREGGMKVAEARRGNGYRELASFVLTGQPAKLALSGARAAEPVEAAPPPVAGAKSEPVAAPPEPTAVEPSQAEARAPSSSGGVPRLVPIVIAGVGVAVAVSGLITFAAGSSDRAALVGHVDAAGNVINPDEAEQVLVIDRRIASNRTVSLALGLTGLAVAATGAVLFFVLAPKDAPQPTALVTPNGVYAGVTGTF